MRIPSPARWWARLSLMVRVMLGASLALVFASILLLFVSTDQDARSARIQIDEHLAGEIDSLLPAIAEWAVIGDYASVEQMFRHRVRRADIRSISWMDDKGRAIEAIDKDVDRRAPRWFVEWTGVLSPGISRTLSIGGRSYGQVTVDMTATPAQNRLWGSFLDHLVILLLALALNVAGIYLVLRNGLRPLSVLTRGADELARGDFTHRIALQGSPELAGLIQAFNRMAEGITAGQAALQDEAERLAVTLSSIGDGVIATDLDGRVEFMNPVAETLTGWTAGEARGHSIQEVFAIINETTRREVECPVDRALREGVVIGLANHTLLISRDGVERAIADSAACIRHADGEPVGAVLVFRDQESERTVARILQESEAELKEAQRIAGVGSWSLNLKTNVLAWSDEVYRIFELAREDLAGNAVAPCYESFLAQVHPDDREAVNRAYTESLETRLPYAIEHRLLMADARIKWVHERCATSYDEDGRPVLSRGTVQDITERKQTEEQLRKLSLAVEQSPESIMITDLEARIEYVNAAFVRNTGYEREEVMGRNPRLLQSGKTPRETYVALWRAMSQGRSWAGEFFNRRKDGGEYTEWATITPLRQADGRVTHYVAIKEDITEQKRMNEELERHREHLEELVAERTRDLTAARDEAERLARAKSEFLANMSHELRTPLNGVLGMARIGVRDSAGRASHETFVRIQDSGAHLLGVINDILDFSKLDAGKLHVERRPFALAAALANATSFVAGAARQKGLAFEVTAAADLPEWVSGDAQRLQQILVNLLSNAVKFTERGEVRLRVARQGEEIWFKVIDTGIGMSEEQAARLFRPFEQADSSTTRKYGGTGLGLAISQNLARLMGGEITVECALGAGCSFTLRLPLPEAQPHLPAHVVDPAAPTERRLAGLRLLAAEDVEVNRLVLEDLLSHEGAHVIFAENGRQALDRLEEAGVSAFDAVLMDIQMPVMNGLDATRRLREIAPALPVIGLTAHAFAEEREKCLAAGMAEHVTKPIDPDLLVAAILRQTRPDNPIPTPALPFTCPQSGIDGPRRGIPVTQSEGMQSTPTPTSVEVQGPVPIAAGLVDWQALLAQYSGREAFVAKLATIALSSQQDTAAKLRAAAAQRDREALAFLAHATKGVAGNLMAHGVRDLAARTEVAARRSEPDAAELATELASAVEALLDELARRHPRERG